MNPKNSIVSNPFRPGAGHMPPYLAGRESSIAEFEKLLEQDVILENAIITGLRGVGKTVLLETLKPQAIRRNWLWTGTDISESFTITEERFALRLLTDLAPITSTWVLTASQRPRIGFDAESDQTDIMLTFETLHGIYRQTPGLVADKIKNVLSLVAQVMPLHGKRGLVFAYDEAQNLADHAESQEYPLSMMLDVFQSLQRAGVPFLLALTGLPTLFSKLVDARTYAERMFRVLFLDRLDEGDSRRAITEPIHAMSRPMLLSADSIELIIEKSGGYPYFIQFICKEVFDFFLQIDAEGDPPPAPLRDILRKLDSDFFAGRWGNASDRQRDLLTVISMLPHCDEEFSVQEIVDASRDSGLKPFSNSHVSQMLVKLISVGLIFRNRYGRYSFAVPLMGEFIRRQRERP